MRILVEPDGFMVCEGQRLKCALGRGGIRADKREGDGATPVGEFALGRIFYRADRTAPPDSILPITATTPAMGWCDDPNHEDYNCLITLPHPAHHERMWRDDGQYDVVVEILYNCAPVRPGLGSAIFLHVAKPDYGPTQGCIALKLEDILGLLRNYNEGDVLSVSAQDTL